MAYLAYKELLWTNGPDGMTRFDPGFTAVTNRARLTFSDDDPLFDGASAPDPTQSIRAENDDGTLIAEGPGGPYFRYSLTDESGTTYTLDLVPVGVDGTVLYLLSDLPPAGTGLRVTNLELVGTGDGSNATPYTSLAKYPCFAPGSLIETAQGWRVVEALQKGDLVRTRDAGFQPILWTGGAQVGWHSTSPHRPVTLDGGAGFGPLTLSAQHRVLLTGPELRAQFGLTEALAPVAGLDEGAVGVGLQRWHHILLDAHHVIRANGLWVESLLATAKALSWLPEKTAAPLLARFPDGMEPVRPVLRKYQARMLVHCAGTGSRAA